MKIETKFNIDDEIFTIFEDNIVKGKVARIMIESRGNSMSDTEISYMIYCENGYAIQRTSESKLFATKQELIEYINENF